MPGSHIARLERARLCDVLTEAGQEAPTLCEGWLTRDLAAHLFVRERRPLAMPGILLGGRFAKLTAGSMASALRRHGYTGLVAKVRSGPPAAVAPARRSGQHHRAFCARRRRTPSGAHLRSEG